MARAAWLAFAGGMTHSEAAKRLHIPSFKVQRLIARATREGLIRVFVNSPVAECVRLEHELRAHYGLAECVVAPDLGEDALPLKTLAPAGAELLMRVIQQGSHRIIGLGHGRTLTAIVDHLPRIAAQNVSFVALLGGLTTSFSADPYDVIHRISYRTGSAGYFLPMPFFANSAKDRAVMLSQYGVSHVMDLARRSTFCLVGIGTSTGDGFLATSGAIGAAELRELERLDACSEIMGYFHDAEGRLVETEISRRIVTLTYEELSGRQLVAAAGGADKIAAIRSVLKSGLLSGFVTDEATAARLTGEKTETVIVMRGRANRKRVAPQAKLERRPRRVAAASESGDT
jgi:DNA-binding transcriptional regulator LsrR (DeoR family)